MSKKTEPPKLLRPEVTEIVLTMVKNERVQQDMEYGLPDFTNDEWVDKMASAVNNLYANMLDNPNGTCINELVETAALLVSWIESEYVTNEELRETKKKIKTIPFKEARIGN